MTWVCPSCGQEWPEKPLVDGTIGCPACGNIAAVDVSPGRLAARVQFAIDQALDIDASPAEVEAARDALAELESRAAEVVSLRDQRDQWKARASGEFDSLIQREYDRQVARADALEQVLREIAEPNLRRRNRSAPELRRMAREALMGQRESRDFIDHIMDAGV